MTGKEDIAALVQLLTEWEMPEASIRMKGMSLVLLLLDRMILLQKWLAPPILKPFTSSCKDIIPLPIILGGSLNQAALEGC